MKRKSKKTIISIIIALLLIISVIPVNAYSSSLIDRSHKGSITLYSYNTEGKDPPVSGNGYSMPSVVFESLGFKPIQGVTFTVTRVVQDNFRDYDGRGTTYLTKDGATLPTAQEVISSLNSGNGKFRRFNTYTVGPTDSEGKAPTLSNLNLGIYLIQQTGNPEGMIDIAEPIVTTLPYNGYTNSWNYDIVAYPKSTKGYVLTYDANNGTGQTTSEPRIAGSSSPLTANSFTNGTKVFAGWADRADAVLPDYSDEEIFKMPEANKTIYAVWIYTSQIRYYTAFKYSEPWGLKLSMALVNPKTGVAIDTTQYNNYGMYVYKKNTQRTNDSTLPSIAEIKKNGVLYSSTNTDYTTKSLEYNGRTENYVTLTYDENIKTQHLNDEIYTLSYITYKGRTFWGNVKDRTVELSIDSIIQSKQIGLTTFTDAEVQLATAIQNMYISEYNRYSSYFNKEGGKVEETYPSGTPASNLDISGYTTNNTMNYETSLRAIDPWGFKLRATNNEETDFKDYGCVVYVDTSRKLRKRENTLTFDDLLGMEGSKVYNKANSGATIETSGDKNYIQCYEIGMQTYRMAQTDVYTCFYYNTTSSDQYKVSAVKRRNFYDLAETGKTQTYGKTDFTKNNVYQLGNYTTVPKTIEVECEYQGKSSDECVIVSSYYDGNSNGFIFYLNTGGRPTICTRTISDNKTNYRGFNIDVTNRYVHLTITHVENRIKLYVDGEYYGMSSPLYTDFGEQTHPFCLGGDTRPNNWRYFKGVIGSVKLFNTARTDEQILNDYENGVSSDDETLILSETYADRLSYNVYDSMINLYRETYYYKNGYYPTASNNEVTETNDDW